MCPELVLGDIWSPQRAKNLINTHTHLRVQSLAKLISVIKSHKMKLVASLRTVKVTVTFRETEEERANAREGK